MARVSFDFKKGDLVWISLIVVLVCAGFVIAQWDGAKVMFHDSEDVKITIDGLDYSLQNASDEGLIGGGGASGETFVRWGRFDCPAGVEKVYEGYTAGNHIGHGGGVNTLCLTKSPTWSDYSDADQNGNLVYGTEFNTAGYGVNALDFVNQYSVACVVCYSEEPVMMQPGSKVCPTGWDLLYDGYLMSHHYTQSSSDTICVDRVPEQAGSNTNTDQDLLYPTEVQCSNNIPCGTYPNHRELTCSLCAKSSA